jgi:hypothetical protein
LLRVRDGTDGSYVASGMDTDEDHFIDGDILEKLPVGGSVDVILVVPDLGPFLNTLLERRLANIRDLINWLSKQPPEQPWVTLESQLQVHLKGLCQHAIVAELAWQERFPSSMPIGY